MIVLPHYRDRSIAVLGLARSGLAAAEALRVSGAHVAAWDDDATAREGAAARGIALTATAEAQAAINAEILTVMMVKLNPYIGALPATREGRLNRAWGCRPSR